MRPPGWLGLILVGWLAVWNPLGTGAALAQEIGPAAVWQPSVEVLHKFQECGLELECSEAVMRRGGASPAAVAFTGWFARQGHQVLGYLESFREMGRVDLASVMIPGRANTNQIYLMVNGTPGLVSTEDHLRQIDLTQDPRYFAIAAKYPKIMLWSGGAVFKQMEGLPGGGQRFIFAYDLKNGCHACEVGGSAYVAFDFDARGKFLGTKLLHLTQSSSE